MPINTLEYADLLQKATDQQIVREATSGWMEANAGQVKYSGGREVKIPRLSTNGLADYDRDAGYVQGAVTLTFATYVMTMDRGRKFQLDSMDVEETAFIANASAVMAEFQRANVIPEIDAYRYSKLAATAIEAGQTEEVALTADTALAKLNEHIRAVQDYVGDVPLIVTMPSSTLGLVEAGVTKSTMIIPSEFRQGDVFYRVRSIDNNVLKTVPAERLKTKYIFNDGTTGGQEAGGFVVDTAGGAKDIHWIIAPATTPLAISKTDKIRIFDPSTYQKADAWSLDYRKYHDLWVLDSRKKSIFVCTKA